MSVTVTEVSTSPEPTVEAPAQTPEPSVEAPAAPAAEPVQQAPAQQEKVQEPEVVAPPVQQAPAPEVPAPQVPAAPVQQEPARPSVYYKNCDAVRAAGAAPLHRGDPGYRSELDRDGDGIACEWTGKKK